MSTTIVDELDDALKLGLDAEGRWFRSDVARGIEPLGTAIPNVDRAAGVIRGYSVITIGPALGHDMHVDATTLKQVADLGNAAKMGVKSRFDHPSASNTSMGTFLGRSKNFTVVGSKVIADLHLSESAKDAPQGDLYTYVMGLAERDPQAFGASIVFDGKPEQRLNPDGTSQKDANGRPLPRLARVANLLASDVVDDPAANPGGLFHQGESLASKASAFLNRWAQNDLLPSLLAMLAANKEAFIMSTATDITPVQLDAARAEGVKQERARVSDINKSFKTVWGDTPPAGEDKVRDGLVELGTSAADAETYFKTRKLTMLTNEAPKSAGGGSDAPNPIKVDLSKLPLEDRCKVEFDGSPELRDEFGSLSVYVAFKRAEANGQVKILKK
jgi:hypothetical protein